MTKQPNIAASVKARILNIAKEQQQPFDVILIRYALERLIYRLGISPYAERDILKGGLLVSLWLEDAKRQTRDADFLGSGDASEAYLVKVFTEIMQIEADDALRFDTDKLTRTSRSDALRANSRLYQNIAAQAVIWAAGTGNDHPDLCPQPRASFCNMG